MAGGSNLLIDPGFESGIWFTPWPGYTSAGAHTDSQDSSFFMDGSKSFKITVAAGTTDGGRSQGPTENPLLTNLKAGTYTFSGWVKTLTSVVNAHCVVREKTGAAVVAGGHVTSASQDWTLISGTFIADGVTNYEVLVGLGSYGAASGGTAYFDQMFLGQYPSFREKSIRPRPFAPGIAR